MREWIFVKSRARRWQRVKTIAPPYHNHALSVSQENLACLRINGIENFWNQAKRHLRRFNGIPKAHFPLYLKECEWRFNNPCATEQKRLLKRWVKRFMG